MVVLNLNEENGHAIYLDVHTIEQRREKAGVIYAVTGTLGDGQYEGEVLIEAGSRIEVTFVDEWLGKAEVMAFFGRAGREAVAAALREAVVAMRFCVEDFPSPEDRPANRILGFRAEGRWFPLRPRGYGEQLELPMAVAEGGGGWSRAAA